MRALFGTIMLILIFWHVKQISTCALQKWRELHLLVNEMRSWNCTGEYYTPKDVQSNCLDCALQCFSAEFSNVEVYCEDNMQIEVIRNIQLLLSENTKDCKTTPQPCHNCNICEEYTEMPFKSYTEEFLTLVQRVIVKILI